MIKDSGERRELQEEWRSCVGYEGLYEVSNFGRVRSLRENTRIKDKENRIMKQKIDDKGYYRVNLNNGKRVKAYLVSRLVAEAFIPNIAGLPHVGHNDDNKANNHVSNLYWTDPKENNHHNGKYARFLQKHNEKIDVIARKISKPVIQTDLKTGQEVEFWSMQEASRQTGVSSGKISMVCAGKRKSAGGYAWRLKV